MFKKFMMNPIESQYSKILKKIVIKRLLLLICIGLTFSATASQPVQAQKLSIAFKKKTLEQCLQLIQGKTGVNFYYNAKDIRPAVTLYEISFDEKSVPEILEKLLQDTGLEFRKVSETKIVIRKINSEEDRALPAKQPSQSSGSLKGRIIENGTSEPLTGATVQVMGTNLGTITDFDGNYEIKRVPVGEYTVEVRFVSYQTKQVTGVTINADHATRLDLLLQPDNEELGEVLVKASYKQASAEGLYAIQKNSVSMANVISAELIAKTPDSEVGATLKRITGVTTIDNKYVIVRSMGDRWNQAIMDGINLPSTDAYQQHFSFDIIPNAIVDGIVINKTATPDMNANFTGGAVEVKTKDIPGSNFITVSIGTSYNSVSTFKDAVTKQRGKFDYFGFDDGTRDFPDVKAIDRPSDEGEAGAFIANSQKFTQDNFTNYRVKTPLNTSYQFAMGRMYDLRNNSQWGFVGALTLKNTQETQVIDHTERGQWMNNSLFFPVGKDRKYYTLEQYGFKNSGSSYSYNSTLSGIFNTGIQLGSHHLGLRNTYTHFYDNQLTQIKGWDYYNDDPNNILNGSKFPFTETVDYPVYQTFLQNKIEGSHDFKSIKINWFTSRAYTKKETRDATFTTVNAKQVEEDIQEWYQVSNSGADIYRQNNWNSETDYNWGASIKWTFQIRSTKHDVKAGYFGVNKKAENQQEKVSLYYMVENPRGKYINSSIPFSELLDGSYYKWGSYGWEKYNYYGEKYIGKVEVHAPYLMFDHRFTPQIRLVWGARAEHYVYTQVQSQTPDSAYITEQLDQKRWQVLPSLNVTLSPVQNLNIRFSYNKSVIRPQFAERLQVPYYDPVRSALVLANATGIVSSVAENYDIKMEWFPTSGEIISAGVYHKNIQDPIGLATKSRTIF